MRLWEEKAPAIIQAWYPGMEGGTALASILFGDISPSGKLPMTFPKKLDDSPDMALSSYPDSVNLLIDHKEDIFVGYRYYDTYNVEPAYPFGHGLSYTSFEWLAFKSENSKDGISISLTVKNAGDVAGAEVVQVYIKDHESSLKRPEKELKAFKKVFLEPGESKNVQFMLEHDAALQFFDDTKAEWVAEDGKFSVIIGASSRDIKFTEEFEWLNLSE